MARLQFTTIAQAFTTRTDIQSVPNAVPNGRFSKFSSVE